MATPSSHLPLKAVIAEAMALDETLGQTKFPQARHHARVLALRAAGAGFDSIASSAQTLSDALGRTIRPERESWAPILEALHQAIDQALEEPSGKTG